MRGLGSEAGETGERQRQGDQKKGGHGRQAGNQGIHFNSSFGRETQASEGPPLPWG